MRPLAQDVLTSFWRLLPANPIVVRVVYGGSRRVRHLWVRAGYLVILFFVVLMLQLSQTGGGGAGTLASLAKSSTRIFEMISVVQLAMMCFLAPIFTAGAISQEKDAETFNVLLTTPLTNAQIVLGSLLSRLFFVIMLLLSGLPIFCITMLYGGVTGEQIFLSFGIAGCTAMVTGALAILISVVRVGTRGTIFSFYLGIAVFLAAGYMLGKWSMTHVAASLNPVTGKGMSWLAPFHPFLALEVALRDVRAPEPAAVAGFAWPVRSMLSSPQTAYMWVTGLASLAMVVLATFFVRRGVKQGEPSVWSKLIPRWTRSADGSGERRRRVRRVWANPVAWREAMTRASASGSLWVHYSYMGCGITAGLLILGFHLFVGFATPGEARQWLGGLVLIEFVTVLLMAANSAATAVSREREAGTMELLLSTPLTSRYIIWGKLRGLVSFTVPLMAVPAGTVLLGALIDLARGTPQPITYLGSAIALPFLLLAYSALACVLGLHMSLKNRGSVQAVLATVGILLGLGFGLGLCGTWAMNSGEIGALLTPLTFVTAVWFVLNPDDLTRFGGGMRAIELQVFMVVGTAIAVGLYGAIVSATYKSMITNFDMIVRKQQR